jgi:hypothetical protein
MKKLELDRLVTFTLFAKMYPKTDGTRGVKVNYLYNLKGEKTSEKNRINPRIIEISGVKFIYLDDYALHLLKLTFEEARGLINKELETQGVYKKEINSLSKHKETGNSPEESRKPANKKNEIKPDNKEDNNFYIE